MIEINLKELLEELQKREVQSDNNDHTQFKSIQTLFEQIQNNRGQVGLEEPHYNLHFHREQSKILDKYLMKKDPKKIVKINKDYRKNKKQQSDTDSLSIVKDSVPQVKFMESLQWFQYLGQNEKIFQSQIFNRNYIIFQQLDNCKQFEDFSNLIIDKGYNTVVYSGVDLLEISHIAIKQTLVINDFLEHAQQYIIQNEIYELYPNIFLKIILPVYIHSISQEKALFVSQMELGTINLFEYAQEHKIRDEEYQLIFQQIYIQITKLHHHKIAHRDIKPQNIIFVNNKGWLLCDFGEALKYEKQQSVYNIRGTFGFIPPRIYQASKIGDVLVQQDLLYNDLYALGITLLVIKHQIKKSSEIDDYLDKQDEIIQKLVENTKLKQLDQFQIDENQQFIEPNVKKSKQIDFQQLGNKEIMEYINVLKNIDFGSPPPFLEKLIKTVDNYLVKIESDRLNYLYICQNIYQCPEYIKYFHNIPKFKMLRQVKFWRQKNKQINLVDQEQLISFMNQLGFIDLVLQFGYQYLTQKYSFSVHIIIIKTLFRLKERDRALNEYKLLLKFRDQYFMNDHELKLLIQISVFLLDFRFINQSELKYLAERNCVVSRFDLHHLEIDYDNSEEFLVEQIMSQYNSQKKKGKFISEYNIDQINIQTLRQQMIDLYSLQLCDKLNDEILKVHKVFDTAFLFQLGLSQSIQNKVLLERQQNIGKIKKQMNFLLIHNSESIHQYHINNLLKQSTRFYQEIRNKQLKQRTIDKILICHKRFSKFPYYFYKVIILKEMLNIMVESIKNFDTSWIRIAVSTNNIINQVMQVDDQLIIQQLTYAILLIYQKTKNLNRISYLNAHHEVYQNQQIRRLYNLKIDKRLLKARIQGRYYKLLQGQFLKDRYLNIGI